MISFTTDDSEAITLSEAINNGYIKEDSTIEGYVGFVIQDGATITGDLSIQYDSSTHQYNSVKVVNNGTLEGSLYITAKWQNIIFENAAGATISGTVYLRSTNADLTSVTISNAGTIAGSVTCDRAWKSISFTNGTTGMVYGGVTLGDISTYDNRQNVSVINYGLIGAPKDEDRASAANLIAYGVSSITNKEGGVITGNVTLCGNGSSFINESTTTHEFTVKGGSKTVTSVGRVNAGTGDLSKYGTNVIPCITVKNTGTMSGTVQFYVKAQIDNSGTMGNIQIGEGKTTVDSNLAEGSVFNNGIGDVSGKINNITSFF